MCVCGFVFGVCRDLGFGVCGFCVWCVCGLEWRSVDFVFGVCTEAVRFHSMWSVVLFRIDKPCTLPVCLRTTDTRTPRTDTHSRNCVRIENFEVLEVANLHKARQTSNRSYSACEARPVREGAKQNACCRRKDMCTSVQKKKKRKFFFRTKSRLTAF